MSKMKLFNFIRRIFTPKKFKQKILEQKFKKAPVMDCGLWAKLKAEKAAKTAKEVESKDKDLFSNFFETRGRDVDPDVMTVGTSEKALYSQLKKSREYAEEINTVDLIS